MNKRDYKLEIDALANKTVPGFFLQDDPEQEYIEKVLPRFGLIDQSPDRWTTFVNEIKEFNETAAPGVQYKVFFLGRHGEGYHNVGEARYPADGWVDYWVQRNGDGDIVWGPDPRLTELGQQQARDAHSAWKEERRFDIPIPEKLYTSPLTRAIQTNQLTFDESIVPGLEVTILENVREYFGVFTPDKRRSRTEIHEEFPEYLFEDDFKDEDPLWTSEYREAHDDVVERGRKVLDVIFDKDKADVISITSHGGFLGALLRFVGHRSWRLLTGGVIPVIIKGSIIEEK
ncbi:histidine phosphatase superfamily [Butyriboletus roseoflavus]|nr:histidine phosphatase superfamily [Butyriboletus roseoflavus]